jgi:gag-polypeptide of LTR copia-type
MPLHLSNCESTYIIFTRLNLWQRFLNLNCYWTSKKGASTCAQFIQHMQSFAYRLRSVGSELTDQDLVLYTLQGLGSEYENFITTFSMRHTDSSMVFQRLLLAHETRLQASLPLITSSFAQLLRVTITILPLRPFLLLLPLLNNFLLLPIIKGVRYSRIPIILDLTGVEKVQEVKDVVATTLILLKLLVKFVSSGVILLLLAICATLFRALRTAAGFLGDGIRKKDTEIPPERAFV